MNRTGPGSEVRQKETHHRETEDTELKEFPGLCTTNQMFLRARRRFLLPPEAVRKVAGGASAASDHRLCISNYERPRQGSWTRDSCPGISSTPAGVDELNAFDTGGCSLALAPPATLRAASGGLRSRSFGLFGQWVGVESPLCASVVNRVMTTAGARRIASP